MCNRADWHDFTFNFLQNCTVKSPDIWYEDTYFYAEESTENDPHRECQLFAHQKWEVRGTGKKPESIL